MNNEKFLNQTGLAYYHNRAKTVFDNKIEKIKVNGTEQTITNKEVDLDLTNYAAMQVISGAQTNFVNGVGQATSFIPSTNGLEYYADGLEDILELASKDYVDANGGKIDTIKVNGTTQTITNKAVDLEVLDVDWEEDRTKIMKKGGLSSAVEFIDKTEGAELSFGKGSASSQTRVYKTLVDKTYVDGKGSVAIDSSSNNKTTFTNGTSTSSLQTSPDGIIYTEGATATEVPSKAYVDDAIAGVTGMEFVMVDELPAEGQKGKIYLVPNQSAGSNIKDEYIWIQDGANGRFEKIGSTDVDLSNYYNTTNLVAITTAEIDTLFA